MMAHPFRDPSPPPPIDDSAELFAFVDRLNGGGGSWRGQVLGWLFVAAHFTVPIGLALVGSWLFAILTAAPLALGVVVSLPPVARWLTWRMLVRKGLIPP